MDTVLRIAVTYVFLMIVFRIMGKRELSKLSPFELVTLLLIPEILSQAMSGEDHSMTGALTGVSTLLCLVFLTSILTHRFRWFERIIESPPTVLVDQGTILTPHMDRERIQADELFGEMHKAGIERLSEVRWAILESDGHISFIRCNPDDSRRPDYEDEPT